MNEVDLIQTMSNYGIVGTCIGVSDGPAVIRYNIKLNAGTGIRKVDRIKSDLALDLGVDSIEIHSAGEPSTISIDIPKAQRQVVTFEEVNSEDTASKSGLTIALGKDICGNIVTCDLTKMPHLLIAGTTGSGKSVCMNSIIAGLLKQYTADEVKFVMIDPKQVEFNIYENVNNLLMPIVTETENALECLVSVVTEMEKRYSILKESGSKDIDSYNRTASVYMPRIVIFIDELADLMMTAGKEVETQIVRLAQKSRAAGIHMVIATQKPTVNVVTGLIKSNIPSRIALSVTSGTDSRVVLDEVGAEKLLGNGDMLYKPIDARRPVRLQGCYISEDEIRETVDQFARKSYVWNTGKKDYSHNELMSNVDHLLASMRRKGYSF